MVETWVSLVRFSPLRSTVGCVRRPQGVCPTRPSAQSGSKTPGPRSGCRPTVKCSEETKPCHSARSSTLPKKERATASLSSRSRFLVKLGWPPDRVVHIEAHEPAVEQVVLDVLHQLALRADALRVPESGSPATDTQVLSKVGRRSLTVLQIRQAAHSRGHPPPPEGCAADAPAVSGPPVGGS
jgi:hypothetical protein